MKRLQIIIRVEVETPFGEVANVLDFNIVLSEFEF